MGTDTRIGQPFLYPGIGYGGSCFPKDVQALIHTAGENGYEFRILEAVENVNQRQKSLMAEKAVELLGEDLSGKRIALWGLAFKPNTDDMRETPAITLIDALLEAGASVVAHDPEAADESRRHYLGDRIEYAKGPMEAVEGANALVLVTEWNEFRALSLDRVKSLMVEPVMIDLRNVYDPPTMAGAGFRYVCVGRGTEPNNV